MTRRRPSEQFKAPFLRNLSFKKEAWPGEANRFPFNLPIFRGGTIEIAFREPITILIGENGTGKSTLLEAIAHQCGFNPSGGSRNHAYESENNEAANALNKSLRLGWLPRVTRGFFMRAESFSDFAKYIDDLARTNPGLLDAYGGKSLLGQSHGESFLALFQHRFGDGIYILDEPEAALSPSRQLAFLAILREMEQSGRSQVIMATHSPILMSYPGAQLLHLDETGIHEIEDSKATSHFQITRDFLNSPDSYLRRLFDEN